MNRRGFLSLLGGAGAASALDLDRLNWVKGKTLHSVPKPQLAKFTGSVLRVNGNAFMVGDWFTVDGVEPVTPGTCRGLIHRAGAIFLVTEIYPGNEGDIGIYPPIIEQGSYQNVNQAAVEGSGIHLFRNTAVHARVAGKRDYVRVLGWK